MTLTALAAEYKQQLDYLQQKMNEYIAKYPRVSDKDHKAYKNYEQMYKDTLYAYKQLMRYINA